MLVSSVITSTGSHAGIRHAHGFSSQPYIGLATAREPVRMPDTGTGSGGTGTFRAQDLSFPRTNSPYGELSFPRLFVPRGFVPAERKFPGTFVPGSFCSQELSFLGNESSWELS